MCSYIQVLCTNYPGHKCSYPGCTSVFVIDGNMKNRRDICAATEAGFAEYKGLPGMIKTGCQRSPAYQSQFCYEHSPRVASMTCAQDEHNMSTTKENVMAFITSKKQLRSGTHYQVIWAYSMHIPGPSHVPTCKHVRVWE